MRRPHSLAAALLSAVALLAPAPLIAQPLIAQTTPADTLRVGVTKVDITPTALKGLNPMPNGEFTAVHDPLFARALVIADGKTTTAIVATDLIEVGDMDPLRRRIERELGIPFNNIMITASHDHSAPRIGGVSPGALAHPGGAESTAYAEGVFDKIVAALKQSKASAQPAKFGLMTGHADVNVNRDEFTGKTWKLGVNPEGPSDKTVWVLRFETPAGKPIAVLFNYAVHNDVTLGLNEVTGDLSGVAQRYVEDGLGDGAVALWTMGPAGDQDPRVFPRPAPGGKRDPAVSYRAADAQGVMVGAEVLRVAKLIKDTTGVVKLAADARKVSCPTKPGVNQMADMTAVNSPTVDLRLGVILLNHVALASVSGEVVTNIYLHLQKASPLANTIMLTLTNDRVGYIADDAAYDRPLFEVNGSPAQRGCAEGAIVGGLTEMISQRLN